MIHLPIRDPSRARARPAYRPRSRLGLPAGLLWAGLGAAAVAVVYPPSPASQAAEGAVVSEERVKAAFLYKFAGYVEWPPEALPPLGSPFTIGVVGAVPLAEELREAVKGRTALDLPIAVKRLRPGDALLGVQILFVGKDQRERLEELAPRAQRRGILTVTESEGALEAGSVINFLVSDQRVRFEISLASAGPSGLRLSSRLLEVAARVLPEAE
jgi:hypothetical protein